ncbi:hypothetical protein D3C75_185170 [compost metagenome]
MKATTLSNGKTYRQISANTFEVETTRVHAETGLSIWMRVTSEKIKAELETVFAVEAVKIDKAFIAFWRNCETTDVLKAATKWAMIHVEALAINEEIDNIVDYAGEDRPIQIDGEINWIFDAAVQVWNRRQRTPVSPPVFTPAESVSGVKSNPDYVALITLVEQSTHLMKVRLFCEVTGQSEQMAELMLSRSDGFLLGAIKAFTGGN